MTHDSWPILTLFDRYSASAQWCYSSSLTLTPEGVRQMVPKWSGFVSKLPFRGSSPFSFSLKGCPFKEPLATLSSPWFVSLWTNHPPGQEDSQSSSSNCLEWDRTCLEFVSIDCPYPSVRPPSPPNRGKGPPAPSLLHSRGRKKPNRRL